MNLNTVVLQAAAPAGGGSSFLIMMGGMFVIMYFFMIRPQMKRAKEARKFQETLEVGQRVITTGGVHGEIAEISDTDVVVKLDQGRMRVEKSMIAQDRKALAESRPR